MKYILSISVEIDTDNEKAAEVAARAYLEDVPTRTRHLDKPDLEVKVSLTRNGDRSGGNLLLPKLEGRFGEHYQGRKASIEEVLDANEE